jgi:peptidoglycan hydrolase-like protein with peptidoglycan-binding domain
MTNNRRIPASNIADNVKKIYLSSVIILICGASAMYADGSVAEIQQNLKDQGFYYGQINGQKDADTTAAIRRYQIRNGLEITGELNDETLKSIRSSPKAQAPVVAASPTMQTPERDTDNSDLQANPDGPDRALAPPMQAPIRPPSTSAWLEQPNGGRPGLGGAGVFAGTPYQAAPLEVQRRIIADAQRILGRRGLFRAPADGTYGPAMEFSLRAYQSRVGLANTGRLDLETLAALELLPGAHAPVFTPRRQAAPREPVVRGEWVRP